CWTNYAINVQWSTVFEHPSTQRVRVIGPCLGGSMHRMRRWRSPSCRWNGNGRATGTGTGSGTKPRDLDRTGGHCMLFSALRRGGWCILLSALAPFCAALLWLSRPNGTESTAENGPVFLPISSLNTLHLCRSTRSTPRRYATAELTPAR